jgi:hypothetical protein
MSTTTPLAMSEVIMVSSVTQDKFQDGSLCRPSHDHLFRNICDFSFTINLPLIAKWSVIIRASLNNSHVSFESAASIVPKQSNFIMKTVSSNKLTDRYAYYPIETIGL